MVRLQRLTIGILISVLAVCALSGMRGTSAQNTAPSSPTAMSTPAPFVAGMLLQLKPNVPFAFLRASASSSAVVLDTAHAGEFVIVLGDSARYDGVQWWWFVERGNGSLAGWVEQNSLFSATIPPTATPGGPTAISPIAVSGTLAATSAVTMSATQAAAAPSPIAMTIIPATDVPTATLVPSATVLPSSTPTDVPTVMAATTVATQEVVTVIPLPIGTETAAGTPVALAWPIGTRLNVAAGIPYVWVRGAANSKAYVRATVYPGYTWSTLTVRESSPVYDGAQYWVLVNVPALNVYGWVEQKSLVAAPIPPTATPTILALATVQATTPVTDQPTNLPLVTATPTTAQ